MVQRFAFTLSRYLANNFCTVFMIVTLAVSVLIGIFEFTELLRRAHGKKHISLDMIIEMAFMKLPFQVEILLPFIVLLTSMLVFWKLTRTHEIAAIRSIGISVWQFIAPAVLITFMLGGIDMMIINPLASSMKARYEFLNESTFQGQKNGVIVSDAGIWTKVSEDDHETIFKISHFNAVTKKMQKLIMISLTKQGEFIRRIDSKEGELRLGSIILHDVWVYTQDGGPQKFEQFVCPTSFTLDSFAERSPTPATLSFWKLNKHIRLLERSGLVIVELLLYRESLIARWLLLIPMVLLGAVCVLRQTRITKNKIVTSFTGILIGFFIYILSDVAYALGAAYRIPIYLSAWAPLVISICASVAIMLHIEDG